MSYAPRRRDFERYTRVSAGSEGQPAEVGPGLLRRLAGALIGAKIARRQRQIEREAVHYLARSGGQLTDNLEREMMQHLMARNRGWRS